MMKLKTTLFLFMFVLLGTICPKAFLELRSAQADISISWPKISFHTPEFKTLKTVSSDDKSIEKFSIKLTKAYQQALYGQWKNTTRQDKKSAIKSASAAPQNLKAKKLQVYKKEPTYRYRKVTTRKGEINSKELIEHYGFKARLPEVSSWSSSYDANRIASTLHSLKTQESNRMLAQVKKESHKVDKVKVEQAAVVQRTEQNTQKDADEYSAKEMDDETWEEELVMIDYSEDDSLKDHAEPVEEENMLSTQEAMQLLANSSQNPPTPNQEKNDDLNVNSMSDDLTHTDDIPASVMSAISREMDKRNSIPTVATVNTQGHGHSKRAVSNEYSASAPQDEKHKKQNEYSKKSMGAGRSVNNLSIHEVLMGQDVKMKELRNFEFFAETLYGESFTDDHDGKIKLDFNLNSSMGVLRGTILKHGYMRTKIDLVLEAGKFDVQIPLIEQDTFSRFLDNEGIYGRGGYVLVKLPQKADTVEIDANYESKIYLDDGLNVVDKNEYYEFVLFAGVKPGNLLISYKNINEKIADKISHVVEDEVLFESGIMINAEELHFSLEEKNLLSRKNSSVNIHPDQINYFNRRTQASQQAVSSYSIQTPTRALGMRDYLEMRHTQIPMFVGLWANRKVELPSESFAQYILDSHQLNSLQNACMVQINLSRPLRDASFFGETKRGPMGIVQSFLDEDGEFNYDPTEMASHIFLVGDLQGTISGKLEYADGSHDFIQTFCSSNTYLVEQL